jgi:hypothetical protein
MLEFEFLLVRTKKWYYQRYDREDEYSSAVVDLSAEDDRDIQFVLNLEGHSRVLLFYRRSSNEWTIVTPRHVAWKLGSSFSCERIGDIERTQIWCHPHDGKRIPYTIIRLCLLMKDGRHLDAPYEPGNPMYGFESVLQMLIKLQ